LVKLAIDKWMRGVLLGLRIMYIMLNSVLDSGNARLLISKDVY